MTTYNVSLADLRQDIAGVIPPDLVLRWNERAKSSHRHDELLAPYRTRGTIVSVDSAGLSRMSQQLALPQVLKLISEPKEVIHALGTAIGGEAIGVWIADNSEMFFGDTIDPSRVVTQMLAVQRRVVTLAVQVGIGIHVGECYKVAGGLFGPDADLIEQLAEDYTAGGETLLSASTFDRLDIALREAARVRQDLVPVGRLWSLVDYRGPLEAVHGEDMAYPIPFDRAFHQRLRSTPIEQLADANFGDYQRTCAVAFVKIDHGQHALLLDAFTQLTLMDLAVRRVAGSFKADVVKSNGTLAIVLCEASAEAVAFARDVIDTIRALGAEAHVGVTHGEVFVFQLGIDQREIAGHPVNVASKLSEDSGLDGILVETSALTGAIARQGEAFTLTISRVDLRGVHIRV